ncbi:MAG: aminotransferase class I/II-fold pyridoxal phosphate-dependent enzyme [Saprospiraceae bacterium]|nr:aminotransferase class I/II-fold pyridoxal phosphate-dependent enzyme [Saprospiraceae bacterium]
MKKSIGIQSACVREINENRTTKPHILPLYATSSFELDDIDQGMRIFKGQETGHVYGRYGNPTMDTVAKKIAQLESHQLPGIEAGAILFSSGMSAILTLILGLLKSGDKILTQANLYGGTTEQFLKIMQPNGIIPVFVDLSDVEQVERALSADGNIKLVYAESPANPTMACIDLDRVASLAKKYNAYSAVDNTFMTPYLQQPFAFGIDFIVHSTTKYLNGHGNSIAGALVAKDADLLKEKIWPVMKLAGTNGNPWDAWLTNNGLKTLGLRMDRHSANAMELALHLDSHARIARVNYPGLSNHPSHQLAKRQMKAFGGMLSFEINGDLQAAVNFMRKLRFCILAPTLGDVDTLILHPATMSHINIDPKVRHQQGISDNLIRVSVGIEDIEDIIQDIDSSLSGA